MEFEKLGNKLKMFAEAATKKTGEAVEVTKLNINIAGIEKQVDDLYKVIGEKVYSATVGGAKFDPAVMDLCQNVNSLLFKIESISMEIDSIKNPVYASSTAFNAQEEAACHGEASPPIEIKPEVSQTPPTDPDAEQAQ